MIYLQLIGTAFWFGHTIPSLKKPVQLFVAYSWIWNASWQEIREKPSVWIVFVRKVTFLSWMQYELSAVIRYCRQRNYKRVCTQLLWTYSMGNRNTVQCRRPGPHSAWRYVWKCLPWEKADWRVPHYIGIEAGLRPRPWTLLPLPSCYSNANTGQRRRRRRCCCGGKAISMSIIITMSFSGSSLVRLEYLSHNPT